MKKTIVNLSCALLVSAPAFAAPPDAVLPEIVATASRWEEPVERVPQDVSVITAQEIERRGVPFVADLLRFQPDLQVIQNGGLGTNATVRLRGSSSGQTLVLIDGFKFNNPATGSADISNLLTSDVERIEIIKGPQSTLYGSEATAGVVNIITKKGAGKLKGDLTAEGGSFSTVKTAGTVSGGTDRTSYRLSATWLDTDGISIAEKGSPNSYNNKSVSARVGANPTDNSSVELNLRYGADKVHLDGYDFGVGPVDAENYVQDRDNYLIAATARVFPWERYEQSLALSYLSDDLDSTDPVTAYNNYRIKSKTEILDWQHTVDLHPVTVTGGFAYRRESTENVGSFDHSINNKAGYLNAKLALVEETLILNAGMRYDDHSTFGDAFTYRTGVLYHLNPLQMRFKANVGSGFRAPSLNELYYPFYGNLDLKPERSTGYDLAVEKDLLAKRVTLSATWFWQKYRNLIQTDPNTFTAANIGRARTKGVEIKATALPTENLRVNAAYTYLDAIDKETGDFLPLRPRSKVASSVEYTLKRLTVSGEYLFVSRRFDSNLNTELGAYSLVNLRASYLLLENLSLFVRVDNLLDKSYQESAGYGTPGISAFGGAKVSF